MKIYSIKFDPMYPVGGCLIIAANDQEEAMKIASETITHTTVDGITEIDISLPCVIKYKSGDY